MPNRLRIFTWFTALGSLDQSHKIEIDKPIHILLCCTRVSLKKEVFWQTLNIYHFLFVFKGREMTFVNFHTLQNILEFVLFLFSLYLVWIEYNAPTWEKERIYRIFSNYSDFCRLGNKSWESWKGISPKTFFQK